MDVIPVIPIGSKVNIKNSEASGTIESITIDGDTVSYHIVNYDNVYGKRGYWVKENEISSRFKKTTLLQSMIREDSDVIDNIPKGNISITTNTIKAILEFGFYIPIADKPETLDVTKLPRVEVVYSNTYNDDGDRIYLPKDKYFKVYINLVGTDAEYEPIMTLTRECKLKPFYKRWYNTLKYGRDHKDNFDYIESNHDYFTRVVSSLIESCPNGFMCNENILLL